MSKKEKDMQYYLDHYKSIKLESKLLFSEDEITQDEINFMLERAKNGFYRDCYQLGLYYHLRLKDKENAEKWWKKFISCSNGNILLRAFYQLSNLCVYDWAYRCLNKAAKKGNKKAIKTIETIKSEIN